jgi:hypothetical protein
VNRALFTVWRGREDLLRSDQGMARQRRSGEELKEVADYTDEHRFVLIFEDQPQVLNSIERFRTIADQPFLDRGTMRQGCL